MKRVEIYGIHTSFKFVLWDFAVLIGIDVHLLQSKSAITKIINMQKFRSNNSCCSHGHWHYSWILLNFITQETVSDRNFKINRADISWHVPVPRIKCFFCKCNISNLIIIIFNSSVHIPAQMPNAKFKQILWMSSWMKPSQGQTEKD